MEYREKRVCHLNDKGEIVKEEIVKEPIYTTQYLRTFNMAHQLLNKHSLDRLIENMKPLPLVIAQCRDWCIKNNIEPHNFDTKYIRQVLIEEGGF